MPPFCNLRARRLCAALGWLLLTFIVQAHDTIIFDPTEAAKFSMNGTWSTAAPVTLHGMAMARVRPEGLQIELTMADGAAYKLLETDPFPAPADSGNTNTASAQHFSQDQTLLTQRGATLFALTNNGTPLKILAVNVALTSSGEIIFRLTYPPGSPGSLDFHLTYLDKIPPGQKDLLTVLDSTERTLGSASLNLDNPNLTVTVPEPSAATGPIWHKLLETIAGVAIVAGLLVLLQKLGQRQQAK